MNADKILFNARVFNAFTRKFEPGGVAIKSGKILYAGKDAGQLDSEDKTDMNGRYIIPGLIDCHMHIESSMTTPARFSDAVLKHGTTSVVADAHEIANVYGMEGIKSFLDSDTDLDIFYAVPSSVPSTNESTETTGGTIGPEEAAELLKNKKVICLGEVMDYNGLVNNPDSVIRRIIRAAREEKPNLPIEGHIPRITGLDLAKFLYEGVGSDHTQQDKNSIIEKISNGVFLQFQKKSVTKDNMSAICVNNFYDYACFVTDDVMVDDLRNGHLNTILKLAVSCGMPVEQAIYMCTYTPARHMGLRDRGCIAPGKTADLVVLGNISGFEIDEVYKNGIKVFDKSAQNHGIIKMESSKFPEELYRSIRCRELTADDLRIKVTDDENIKEALCNVIQIESFGTFTKHVKQSVPVKNGILEWKDTGFSLLIVMERYGKTGGFTYALVDNGLKKRGAVGTTWAHDHHNLMVMGTDAQAIIMVQHKILREQGGYAVSSGEKITAFCPLPIGGIISDEPIDKLGMKLAEVRKAMEDLGYVSSNVIMSFSTLSLPVSPEIKVTDKGIFDCLTQNKIPIVEELK